MEGPPHSPPHALRRAGFRNGRLLWVSPSVLLELEVSRLADVRGVLDGDAAKISAGDQEVTLVGLVERRGDLTVVESTTVRDEPSVDNLYELSTHPCFALDRDGRILLWNLPMVELTGLPACDALGERICLSTGASLGSCQALVDAVFSGQHLVGHQLRISTPRSLVLSLSASLAGEVGGAILISAQDVTAEARESERLHQAQEHYRDLLLGLRDVVFELDEAGLLTFLSPSWSDLTGLAVEGCLGRPLHDFLLEPVELDLADGSHEPLLFLTGDGSTRWFSVSARGHQRGDARITVGTLSDASARVSSQDALAREGADARAKSQAKSDFLARMSHEMRTPLNAVMGFAQLLALEELTDDAQDSVDHILAAGRHLLGIINESLDLTRIEAGRLVVQAQDVDLAAVVNQCVGLVTPDATKRSLSVHVDVPSTQVRADPQLLQQVLLNLLSNAVKYNREGGRLEVTLVPALSGERIRIEVRDQGQGLSPDQVQRLFRPFERLGADRSVEGTGLGLMLSARVAQAMGMEISVRSAEGAGSVFCLHL